MVGGTVENVKVASARDEDPVRVRERAGQVFLRARGYCLRAMDATHKGLRALIARHASKKGVFAAVGTFERVDLPGREPAGAGSGFPV